MPSAEQRRIFLESLGYQASFTPIAYGCPGHDPKRMAVEVALDFIGRHHRPAAELTTLVEQIMALKEDTHG